MTRSTLTHLECGMCGATYAPDQLSNLCPACGRPLLARYDLALAAAGVPAERCVFVDDTAENLPPAEALGIRTVHHVDPAATVRLLGQLFTAR